MRQVDHAEPRANVVIAQGQFALGTAPDRVISTILGSCVAVCLWDPAAAVGGMNHILLPQGERDRLGPLNFGASDMERLLNALLKAGAVRRRLRAKAFGGAAMVTGLSDIGSQNVAFVRRFLRSEGIPCVAESLGGTRARRVQFWPTSGRARHRFVGRARVSEPTVPAIRQANGVEFFD